MADMDDPRARASTSGVVRDQQQAATGSEGPCRLSRYPTRRPSAPPTAPVRLRAPGGRSRPTHGRLPIPFPAGLAGLHYLDPTTGSVRSRRPQAGVTMASAGIRKSPSGRYKVWWRLDDASQGSQTFDTRDQARDFMHDLLAGVARDTWVDPRRGK